MNSTATANAVGNLSAGLQSLLMVSGLLGVALAVDPAAAIGVIGIGIVLSLILRPLNLRSRRANRELSKVTRAMATRVTEYTRLSRDFRLFGVETRVMDTLRRLIQDTGHVYRRTQILSQHRAHPVPVLRTRIRHRRHRLPGRCRARQVRRARSHPPPRAAIRQLRLEHPDLDPGPPRLSGHAGGRHARPPSLRRRSNHSRRARCPSPSGWTSIPWSTPTTG